MTIDFICEELAELFDSPCNYSPMDEKMFQDSYCESHCGKITDKECWKHYFEKVWADRKTENSSEKPNNCEDEPTHNQHVQHIGSVETMSCEECKRWIYDDRWGWFCPLKSQDECKFEPKTEPQTDCSWK